MPDPLGLLPRAWWSFSLPGFREHPEPATYSPFAYDNLPPIHAPSDPQFHWLLAKPVHDRWSLATNPYPDGSVPDLAHFPELVATASVSFPESFATFIQDRRLHGRIRSSTACLLELGVHLVASSDPIRGALLHFLSDQQSCLHWCLLATTSRIHCVLVTAEPWGLLCSPGEPAPLVVLCAAPRGARARRDHRRAPGHLRSPLRGRARGDALHDRRHPRPPCVISG